MLAFPNARLLVMLQPELQTPSATVKIKLVIGRMRVVLTKIPPWTDILGKLYSKRSTGKHFAMVPRLPSAAERIKIVFGRMCV